MNTRLDRLRIETPDDAATSRPIHDTPAVWSHARWPLRDLFRPAAAGRRLADAPRRVFLMTVAVNLLACAALWAGLLLLLMLCETFTEMESGPKHSSVAPFSREHVAIVWRSMHEDVPFGWLGPFEATLLVALVGVPTFILALGWLNLPFAHAYGPVGTSWLRSTRASAAVLFPVLGLSLVVGALTLIVASVFQDDPQVRPFAPAACCWLVSDAVSAVLLAAYSRWTVAGLVVRKAPPHLPPRCEGCGYDLTHQPAEQRCPECAQPLATSFAADESRPNSRWAVRHGVASWTATAWEVLFLPGRFYRRLRLRKPLDRDAGFTGINYVLLGLGAGLWILLNVWLLTHLHGPPPLAASDVLPIATYVASMLLFGVVGCWLGHRIIAACVVTFWIARDMLPDYRWAAKVMTYESVYLWVFCAFWGAMITSLVVTGDWLFKMFGFVLGMHPGILTLTLGTVGLAAIWVWRYTVAYRAIRWSNF
jgi:hypothetical protein